MTEPQQPFPKAYDNSEFLHGPQARALRILAEYLEPQARIRQNRIRGTIVFFGSARAPRPEELDPEVARLKAEMVNGGSGETEALQKQINRLERFARYYNDAVTLSGLLTKHYMKQSDGRDRLVVCSGAGPGIMEAANRGAMEAGGKTLGLGISLPFEQGHNKWTDPKLTFEFHYFFMRKYWFVYLARALVIFPGGFGTCDELFEVLTLLQTQKIRRKLPIVLYGSEFWSSVMNFEAMIDWGVISASDKSFYQVCNTPEEAFQYLVENIWSHSEPETGEVVTE